MRVPTLANPPSFATPEDAAVVDSIRDRRGTTGLLPVDLVLLHSPPVASGWSGLLKAIRGQTSLPCSISETAICGVAALTEAWGEYKPHLPLLQKARPSGLREMLEFMHEPAGESPPGTIDERHRAVLKYTDAVTVDGKVTDGVFAELRRVGFTDREIVEITATVSAYNCVCRFVLALDI